MSEMKDTAFLKKMTETKEEVSIEIVALIKEEKYKQQVKELKRKLNLAERVRSLSKDDKVC